LWRRSGPVRRSSSLARCSLSVPIVGHRQAPEEGRRSRSGPTSHSPDARGAARRRVGRAAADADPMVTLVPGSAAREVLTVTMTGLTPTGTTMDRPTRTADLLVATCAGPRRGCSRFLTDEGCAP
jgi:hypothetical protein